MSRHYKTFAPRTNRFDAQILDNEEEEKKHEQISSQDAKISLAKTEVTNINNQIFRNRAFNKVEKGLSVIRFTDRGPHVLTLNRTLEELGYKAPGNNTLFWNETKTSLMNFQRDHGIKASGILDAKTLLKMDKALEEIKDKKPEKVYKGNTLSAKLEIPKTNETKDPNSKTYTIIVAKNQKFNGKLIQTDEELNRFAEHKMGLTRHLVWKPEYTVEYIKGLVANGGTVKYEISPKTNSIEKETEELSSAKKQFIKDPASTAYYVQNTRILDLLKQLSDEEIADYNSKTSEETTNLATIEASLKKYIQDRNQRDKEKNNREKLQKQLAASGLEVLYKQYRDYLKFKHSHKNTPYEPNDPNKIYFENALKKQYEELLESLKASGFTFESFGKLIAGYELAFRKETVHLAEDALMKYRHVLFGEKKKLLNDTFLTNLLEKIKASKAKESYLEADKAATPSYADNPSTGETKFKAKMEALARSKKAEGNAAIKNLSSTAPLVEDNGFNKEGFAKIETKQELHDFLEHYINDQEINIYRILANLHKDQGLSIYGYGSLLQKSKEKQGIAQGSIFDLIITDKEDKESTKHIIDGLAIGVLAIALGLLTFGTGTVAVLLAAGNFALSAYLTYEEIDAYRTQLAVYKVDISKDEPSAVWVIISVAGSVLDAAAVAKISKILVKAGRTFEETKDVAQTRKVLHEANLDPETEGKVVKALEEEKAKFVKKHHYNPEQHSEFIDAPENLTGGKTPKNTKLAEGKSIKERESNLINSKNDEDIAKAKKEEKTTIDEKLIEPEAEIRILKSPETEFGKVRMAYEYYKQLGWNNSRIKSHLDGIDFTEPVELVELPKNKLTSQYQAPGGKKGYYFAEPNAKATELGINPDAETSSGILKKTKTMYKTNQETIVLKSRAKSGINDTWSVPSRKPFETSGGGIQYFTIDNSVFIPIK